MNKLLDLIIDNLVELFPMTVVEEWEAAVRLRWGKLIGGNLGPGPHWRIPYVDHLHIEITVDQTLNLQAVSVTTKDGRAITASANIIYRIADVKKLVTTVAHLEDSLANAMVTLLARQCTEETWARLRGNGDDVERTLLREMRVKARRWGVEIKDVGLTDFISARGHRLYLDGGIPVHHGE